MRVCVCGGGIYKSQLVGQFVLLSILQVVYGFFLSTLDLINCLTNFVQTSQMDSVYNEDVHILLGHGSLCFH